MTFASEVAADSPYIWWDTRLVSAGAQPDSSGNGHTGTVHGSPVLSASGLTFDNTPTGADQWIASDAPAVTGGTTYATWACEVVCQASSFLHEGDQIIALDDWPDESGDTGLFNHTGANPGSFRANAPLTGLSAIAPIPTDSLVLLVSEYDGTNVNVYLNGVLDNSRLTDSFQGSGQYVNDETMILAGDALTVFGGGPDGWTGLIRHGMFYDHALGAARVAAHWAALPSDTPPTANTFRPPTQDVVPNIVMREDPSYAPAGNALRRYYPVGPRGQAVFKLPNINEATAAAYTFDQPYPWVDGELVKNGNLYPLPVDPFDAQSNLIAQTIDKVFYGGHVYQLSTGEVTGLSLFLTANGYTPGDWIT